MAVDRSGDGDRAGREIRHRAVQVGGVSKNHCDGVGEYSRTLPLRQGDPVVRGVSRSQSGHIDGREIRVAGGTYGLEIDVESGRIVHGHVRTYGAGVADDRVGEGHSVRRERSVSMAVDIDGDRQGVAGAGRGSRVESKGSGLSGSNIGAVIGESWCIGRVTRSERCGSDGPSRVAAVGADKDEVARCVVGYRNKEVGRAAGDHCIGTGEDRIGKGERISSRTGEIDRVAVIDQRVVGRYSVGRIEGAAVASGEEGVL